MLFALLLLLAHSIAGVDRACELTFDDATAVRWTDCTAGLLRKRAASTSATLSFAPAIAWDRACGVRLTLSIVEGLDYFFSVRARAPRARALHSALTLASATSSSTSATPSLT